MSLKVNHSLLSDQLYFKEYYVNLDRFLNEESLTLTTGEYFDLVNEKEEIKKHLNEINRLIKVNN